MLCRMPAVEERDALKVTVIGGGTGSFQVLSGLSGHGHLALTSIVTMADSGGDSGRLRDEFGLLPPGDLRRGLLALSAESTLLRDLFSFRFTEEPLRGRNFGNLFFLALTKLLGSEQDALAAITKILKVRGTVLPVSWDHVHLCAELANGQTIVKQVNIDRPKHDPAIAIRRVYLNPPASANPDALTAIANSDVLVLAPGDLFTSTIPNLLVDEIPSALCASKAPLVYVLNLMTKLGETNGYSASAHVQQIIKYGGRVPDAVLVHRGPMAEDMLERYRAETAEAVVVDDGLANLGVGLIKRTDLMSASSQARHDPQRTAVALLDIFADLRRQRSVA
jgi:uncharacterized cofD-like protein